MTTQALLWQTIARGCSFAHINLKRSPRQPSPLFPQIAPQHALYKPPIPFNMSDTQPHAQPCLQHQLREPLPPSGSSLKSIIAHSGAMVVTSSLIGPEVKAAFARAGSKIFPALKTLAPKVIPAVKGYVMSHPQTILISAAIGLVLLLGLHFKEETPQGIVQVKELTKKAFNTMEKSALFFGTIAVMGPTARGAMIDGAFQFATFMKSSFASDPIMTVALSLLSSSYLAYRAVNNIDYTDRDSKIGFSLR